MVCRWDELLMRFLNTFIYINTMMQNTQLYITSFINFRLRHFDVHIRKNYIGKNFILFFFLLLRKSSFYIFSTFSKITAATYTTARRIKKTPPLLDDHSFRRILASVPHVIPDIDACTYNHYYYYPFLGEFHLDAHFIYLSLQLRGKRYA